jgi:hypothetical protein
MFVQNLCDMYIQIRKVRAMLCFVSKTSIHLVNNTTLFCVIIEKLRETEKTVSVLPITSIFKM